MDILNILKNLHTIKILIDKDPESAKLKCDFIIMEMNEQLYTTKNNKNIIKG